MLIQIKQLLAVLIALTLVLCMALVPVYADSNAVFLINGPDSLPEIGETFKVTVSIFDNPGLASLQYTVAYNKSAVCCTKVDLGAALNGTLAVENPDAANGAIVAAATASGTDKNGILATYTFKRLSNSASVTLSIKDVVITDAAGKSIPWTVSGTCVFTGSSSGSSSAGSGTGFISDPLKPENPVNTSFSDTAAHPDISYIKRSAELGLFSGYEDGTFKPDKNVTRAQFVTVFWRMKGSPATEINTPFKDISTQRDSFKQAIAWAYSNGFIAGRTADKFDPAGNVTIQEAVRILHRLDGDQRGMETMFTSIYDQSFADSADISSFAKPSMYWAVYNELIAGVDSRLNPKSAATRAQLSKLLVKYLDEYNIKE